MVELQNIPVDFGQGLDTKTDPKAVVAGKFLRLENGTFTNPKRIAKRNGYSTIATTIASIGSISSPKMVHSFKNEAICADQSILLTYDAADTVWQRYAGEYVSTDLSRKCLDAQVPSSGYVDTQVLGNYVLSAFSAQANLYSVAASTSITYVIITDKTTGSIIYSATLPAVTVTTTCQPVHCVILGGTVLAVAYIKANSASIDLTRYTIAAGVVTANTTTISAGYTPGTAGGLFRNSFFDIVPTATGAVVAYINAAGVGIKTIDTSGAVTNTAAIVDATAFNPIHLLVDSANGQIWLYYSSNTTVNGIDATAAAIRYAIYSSTLGVVLASTALRTFGAPYFWISNMTAVKVSTTQQTLYYGYYITTGTAGGVDLYTDQTRVINAFQTPVASPGDDANLAIGVAPYSRAFAAQANGVTNNYAVVVYRGGAVNGIAAFGGGAGTPQQQPTYFVIRLDAGVAGTFSTVPLVVARFGSGLANNQAVLGMQSSSTISYTPNVVSLGSNKFIFPCAIGIQEFLTDNFSVGTLGSPGVFSGSFAYTIDFLGANTYKATTAGDLVMLNGGVIQAFDGKVCTEWNYHTFPEIITAVISNTASGAIANGTYRYLAIYQWTDAQGNLHQSAPSAPITRVFGAAEDTTTLTITTPYLSQKYNVVCAIYRTTSLGSIYYLITNPMEFKQQYNATVATYTFVDTLADSSITANPQAYTYPASSVLENTTPPPSMIMAAHTNRLWFVDAENPNDIWYTKSFQPGTGLSPSGFMLEQIDHKFGDIAALAEMDEKLVIFKDSGVFIQSGDGVSDTGSGSSLSFPQTVPSDVGCSVLKSVITTPAGVMFKSGNGIYFLDRKTNISYIGAEVEAYNSQVITGATLVPGKSQIRFLCSTGLTLVYDYIFNQWSTFTAHTGTSSSTWNNLYIYASSTAVLQEASGVYSDNGSAFALLAQTSWLALAGIQGFQRVRRLIMLGDFVNGNSASHNLSISAAYDFSTTFQNAVTYAFGAASTSGVFQYRERLPIQKCDTISLLIQETTTGSNLEYVDLTNISFEAAIKKGLNKLGGTKSVG